ncbi:hypothetical protein FZO89_13880 [Luteimonas viscosa]|uniref:Uncharacterized protein n=1 Tax=Luteimonas viscosa TaxID=1132694 RepID=A0A5D4XTD1_9GAMM|nr:hypothetical protein [Luteimonas viscosa]TYT27255.1 hypothetical protein FZO89_13880 [Luteimonas viscosa]
MARGSPCRICDHPDRASIELGLANKVPIRVLGKRYGVSADSVWRHGQRHMSAELHGQLQTRGRMTPQDLENLRITESEGVLQHLVAVRGRLYGLMDAATLQDDYRGAAAIGNQIGRNLEVTAKLLGDIRTGTVNVTNNVLLLPEFHALRTTIMQALRQHPEARASVAAALRQLESPDVPRQESPEEREAAADEMAKDCDVTRRSRAKRKGQVIEGSAERVDPRA